MESFQLLKALGPNELHPIFYQRYRHLVGESIINICTQAFLQNKFPKAINKTHICLTPKNQEEWTLKQFRPIRLCNTSYKINSQILALRLRAIMNNLTGPYQSSFLKCRQTLDNAIIVQEMITLLKKN